MPSPFDALPPPADDPIFRANKRAHAAGRDAINGTVGMFYDDRYGGSSPAVFDSVRRAIGLENDRLEVGYGYPPLNGLQDYRDCVTALIQPKGSQPVASIATTGGSDALAVNMRLIRSMNPQMPLVLATPTWPNHPGLADEAGLQIKEVPYLDENATPSIEGMLQAVTREQCALLLHNCCHNPTGLDLSPAQWKDLGRAMSQNGSVALVDAAYQGFSSAPKDDIQAVQHLTSEGVPTLVAWSASKNHTIYSERAGLAAAIVPDKRTKKIVDSQYATTIRRLHSATATYGQRIVTTVQKQLRHQWLEDLAAARTLIQTKRALLIDGLSERFRTSLSGVGLFALLPLTQKDLKALQKKKIFLTDEGRINLGGIPLDRIPELANALNSL